MERIHRITSVISASSNENDNEIAYDLCNPMPFIYEPDARDIFRLPNAGLYYSMDLLITVRPILCHKTLRQISHYADYVYRGSYDEEWIINRVKLLLSTSVKQFANNDTTAIGNIAYLATHCHDHETREIAKNMILQWKQYESALLKTPDYVFIGCIIAVVVGIVYVLRI